MGHRANCCGGRGWKLGGMEVESEAWKEGKTEHSKTSSTIIEMNVKAFYKVVNVRVVLVGWER